MGQMAGFADLLIDSLKGLLTTPDKADCPAQYSPGPCRNAEFSTGGVGSRPGTHTEITLAGGTDIYHQELVFQAAPFQKYYLFLMQDHKLYYSTGGARTLLIDSPPLTDDTTHFKAVQYGNFIYLFFSDGFAGTTAPFVWSPADGWLDLCTIQPEGMSSMAAIDGGASVDGLTPGLHKIKVVFETRTGYRSVPTTGLVEYTAPGGLEVSLSDVPLYSGDADHVAAECVKRHIVMTEAALGTYFIAYTIEDNTTDTAVFAISDAQLNQQTDVTDYFQYTSPLPGAMSGRIYHNRLVMCGDGDNSSLGYVSEVDSPQTFRADVGFLDVRRDDGQRLVGFGVLRNVLYAVKERSTFAYQDNGDPPDQWAQELAAESVGTQSIYGISEQSDQNLLILLDAKGPYRFDGSPRQRLSDNIDGDELGNEDRPTWKDVSFTYLYWGEVHIDTVNKRVYFLVAMGEATRANKMLVADYAHGWNDLRWSDWSTGGDQWRSMIVDGSDILMACASANVQVFDTDDTEDNETAIDYAVRQGLMEPRADGLNLFAGIAMHATGEGTLGLRVYDPDFNLLQEPRGFCLDNAPGHDFFRGINWRRERIAIEFFHNCPSTKSATNRMTVYGKPDGRRMPSTPCDPCEDPPPSGDNVLFAEPDTVCIDDEVEITVYVIPADGFLGEVTLSATDLPTDVTAAFSPNPVTIDSEDAESSILTLTAGPAAVAGTYTITISGTSTAEDLSLEITIENCSIAAIRMVVDETLDWAGANGTSNNYMFRIQEVGSDNLYRFWSADNIEGSNDQPTPMMYRFSPDGRMLAAMYWLDLGPFGGSGNKYYIVVHELGQTLTSGGAFGDVDATPQPNTFILDAPVVNELLSDADAVWQDCFVDNDGNIWALEYENVAGATQENFYFALDSFVPTIFDPFEPDTGEREKMIVITADPAAAVKSQSCTFAVTRCCLTETPTSLTVTADPTEAWWSATSPATGNCAPVAPGFACADAVVTQPLCLANERATATMTITVDITGLPEGEYDDANVDHPGTPIFTYSNTDISMCCELSTVTPARNFTGEIIDGSPNRIKLIVRQPDAGMLTLFYKAVGVAVVTQAQQTLIDTEFQQPELGDSSASSMPKLLDAARSLVVVPLGGFAEGQVSGQMGVVDLSAGPEVVYTIAGFAPPSFINANNWPVNINAGLFIRSLLGFDSFGTGGGGPSGDDSYNVVLVEEIGKFGHQVFTNSRPNLFPESEIANPGLALTPMILLTGAQTGYMINAGWPFDNIVRTLEAGPTTDQITASALPSAVVVTPGAGVGDTARPRAMEPYDPTTGAPSFTLRGVVWNWAAVPEV